MDTFARPAHTRINCVGYQKLNSSADSALEIVFRPIHPLYTKVDEHLQEFQCLLDNAETCPHLSLVSGNFLSVQFAGLVYPQV